jgi:hypothetical protein
MDSALGEIEKYGEENGCLCHCSKGEFLEVVDNTPVRRDNKEQVRDY